MADIYKVWIQIERADELNDEHVNLEVPDRLGSFISEDDARAFVLGMLLVARGGDPATSDQVPSWFRARSG